jgi:hypothetical protein
MRFGQDVVFRDHLLDRDCATAIENGVVGHLRGESIDDDSRVEVIGVEGLLEIKHQVMVIVHQ